MELSKAKEIAELTKDLDAIKSYINQIKKEKSLTYIVGGYSNGSKIQINTPKHVELVLESILKGLEKEEVRIREEIENL